MIRIYNNDEIPKNFREPMILNQIDLEKVKFIIIPDDNFKNSWDVIAKLSKEFTISSTITDTIFYIIFN